MKFNELRSLLRSDLHRITGRASKAALLKQLLFGESYKYIFWMRVCAYCRQGSPLARMFFPIARIALRHYRYKFGISIPARTSIGPGFYIGHFGGIVVNERSRIGKNCNISQGVTIGQSNRGKKVGTPIIGDNVYIGPGAKIIGNVRIGNNVAIGANSVVTHDLPDNAVAAGVPSRILSMEGSGGYVNRTDYPES